MSEGCMLCPRLCGVRRDRGEVGICGQSETVRVARAALHPYEEPCLSGSRGSGTVFFVGCSLRCAFCQNHTISGTDQIGTPYSVSALGDLFLSMEEKGAHNLNLVTPTHFSDRIAEALASVKEKLTIPVVWNSSGYERVETLMRLDGLVDVYMPDFKYGTGELATRYSAAPDYPEVAADALTEMYRQVGSFQRDRDGMLRQGLLVRHLVLPGARKDSICALEALAKLIPPSDILLSLMSQYTPDFAADAPYGELHRRVTSFEYNSVLKRAAELGFDGYMQSRTSATAAYTPDFEASAKI